MWGRLHLDFAEFSQGQYFLVVVDAATGWIEATWTAAPSTRSVTQFLTSLLTRYGLPDILFSDNGTAFASSDMNRFCELLGIKLVHSAPHCPKSNGLAEAAVKVLKNNMKKLTEPLKERIFLTLQAAKHTPNDQGITPAELMHGWRAVTQLDRIRPRPANVEGLKNSPVSSNGQHVWYRVFGRRDVNWAAGTIVSTHGTKIYVLMSRNTWWVHATRTSYAIAPHTPSPHAAGPVDPPAPPPTVAEPPPVAAGPATPQDATTPPAAAACGWPGTLPARGGRR